MASTFVNGYTRTGYDYFINIVENGDVLDMTDDVKKKGMSNFKLSIRKFFNEIRLELKKVIWPTKKELFQNTLTVLAFCLMFGAIIWCFDYVIALIREKMLLK